MTWFRDFFNNLSIGLQVIWDGIVASTVGFRDSSIVGVMSPRQITAARDGYPGYTVKEVVAALALMAGIKATSEDSEKTDDRYDEPQATYPMEMKI